MGSERRYILPFPNKNICLNVECRSSSSSLHPEVVKVGGGSPVLLGIYIYIVATRLSSASFIDNGGDLLTSKQRGANWEKSSGSFFFFSGGSRLREDGRTWRSDEEPLDFGQRRSGGFGWVWWRNHVGLVLIIVGKNV